MAPHKASRCWCGSAHPHQAVGTCSHAEAGIAAADGAGHVCADPGQMVAVLLDQEALPAILHKAKPCQQREKSFKERWVRRKVDHLHCPILHDTHLHSLGRNSLAPAAVDHRFVGHRVLGGEPHLPAEMYSSPREARALEVQDA
jgi:hypothetical protein